MENSSMKILVLEILKTDQFDPRHKEISKPFLTGLGNPIQTVGEPPNKLWLVTPIGIT